MQQKKKDTTAGFKPSIAWTEGLLSPTIAALRLDGRLDNVVLSPAIHQAVLSMARIRNVVSSLRQEGVSVNFEEARRVLDTGRAESQKEELVLRLAREYARIHDAKRISLVDLSVKDVLDVHGRIFKGFPEDEYAPGRLKTGPNGVGNGLIMTYEAMPPERTLRELEQLLEWLKDRQWRWPPAVTAGLFFAEFQCIHPFNDGNGRIGRLLNAHVLKGLGYRNATLVALDGRFFRSGEKYYQAISSTNDGATYHVWCRYFAKMLEGAYKDAVKLADLRPLLDSQPLQAARGLLAWMLGSPPEWFQRSDFPNPQGHSDSSLTAALASLVEQGVLEHNQKDKRARKYRLSTKYVEKMFRGVLLES